MITSLSNPLVKRARKLRDRKHRESEKAFLIEGITHVRRALEHDAAIESLLVAPELLRSEDTWGVIEGERAAGTQVVELGRAAFESITSRDHPSGLAAIARMEEKALTELHARDDGIFVGLYEVGNPGNLGSIVRTLDGVGGAGAIVVGASTDPFHPVAVKSNMGTMFSVPVVRAADIDELIAWALMERVHVYTTSANASASLWSAEIKRPCLFLFGSEAQGLPPEVLARGTAVSLPMKGEASSLNLAVAAGVVLYEAQRVWEMGQKRDIT